VQQKEGNPYQHFKKEQQNFFIGNKMFTYNDRDQIFTLAKALPEVNYVSKLECTSCSTPFKDYKFMKYC